MGVKPSRLRADQLLVAQGLAESRTRAQALILAGKVFAGDRRIAKAGDLIADDAALIVKGRDHPWVSRGGVKLAHGLDRFAFDVAGATAIDVGSSTGGFTDVLLTSGAAKVFAVDVGTNQLAWKLRQDPRVVVMEQTNAKLLDREMISDTIDIIVCDASFIGLAKLLGPALSLARPGATLVALVKPQFEAGRGEVGKGGVVRDPEVHRRVCDEAAAWVYAQGWSIAGVTPSPITGPEGNVEFLLGAIKEGAMAIQTDDRGVWNTAALTVPAIVTVGFLMGIVSNSGFANGWYAALAKPSFQPPGWAFGAVWTTLYTMMGIALAVVWRAPRSAERSRGLALFGVQLLGNFAWSPLFFGAHAIDPALVLIIATAALVTATIISFWRVRPLAGALLIPYLAWLILATALNHETGRLNPGAGTHSLGLTGA